MKKNCTLAAALLTTGLALPQTVLAKEFTVSACTLDGVNEVITFTSDDNVALPEGVDPQQVLQEFWSDYITGVTWKGLLTGAASDQWKTGIEKVFGTLGEDYLIDKTEPVIGSPEACIK